MFHRPVAELLAAISSAELTEWAGLFQLEAEERVVAEAEAARKGKP